MTRIAQIANFVAPHSGGIRVVLDQLARGYAAAGHEVVQLVPGDLPCFTSHEWGRRYQLTGIPLPGTGYRVLTPRRVTTVLRRWRPDVIEVHDRTTLRGLGRWARERGIASAVVSHERLDRLLAQWSGGHVAADATDSVADRSNARLAAGFDHVVCTTDWAAAEFARIGAANLRIVPLGVDLDRFHPDAADPAVRARLAPGGGVLLASVVRLSPEKKPVLGVLTTAELLRRGTAAALAVAGDGPLRRQLTGASTGLPVHLLGHVAEPQEVVALLATADVVLAPGPVETFGLAAVEALACGTPVVVNAASALPALIGDAGIAAEATPHGYADAVQALLRRPADARAAAARARAETFGWARTVDGFLDLHGRPRTRVVA